MKINIKEIVVGDVFSEESHYIVEEIDKDTIKFKHTESGKSVTLGYGYVQDLLNTSDQYDKEVKARTFPAEEHCFAMKEDVLEKLY